jgi:hypothetical protein
VKGGRSGQKIGDVRAADVKMDRVKRTGGEVVFLAKTMTKRAWNKGTRLVL